MAERASPRSRLQQQRARETRHALAAAAEKLWRERDFDDVSIEDICNDVGVSKGLFYFYFVRKEFLLISLVFSALFPDRDAVLALIEGDAATVEICRELARQMAKRARTFPRHMVLRAIEAGLQHHREYRRQFSGEGGWDEPLLAVFSRGHARGELSPDWPAALLGPAMSWMLVQGLLYWAGDPEPEASVEAILVSRAELIAGGGAVPRR